MSLLGELVKTVRPLAKANQGWSSTTYNRTGAVHKTDPGIKSNIDMYGGVSTLFSIVSKISNSVASTKWHMYRSKEDGRRVTPDPGGQDKDKRTELTRHVALELWKRPTPIPYITSSFFVESFMQHLELTGEARLAVVRNGMSSMPLELWPIRPDRIEPVPDPETFLKGYIYTGPNNEKLWLEVDDLISILMPNPSDPYRGMGVVQALKQDLLATTNAARFNNVFFENDASPGGVIEAEESMSDTEFDRLVEQLRARHQGVNNAHRVMVIERAHWVGSQHTMRDMQFAELRTMSREIIREAFAMHGHMLGLTDDINRANAEAAEDVFARWLMVPRLDRIKDALNHQFLPLFGVSGDGVEFDFDDPSLEDSEANNNALLAKAQAAKTLVEAGGEFGSVLEACGLPAIVFDQAKVDREAEAQKAKAEALQAGNKEPAPSSESGSKEEAAA